MSMHYTVYLQYSSPSMLVIRVFQNYLRFSISGFYLGQFWFENILVNYQNVMISLNYYYKFIQVLDIMQKVRTLNSAQSSRGQIQFRIIAKSIRANTKQQSNTFQVWKLYLEKGMQILGQTTSFLFEQGKSEYQFDHAKNKFDFQIVSQKNLNYAWSLYLIDDKNFQERIDSEAFSIRECLQKYQKESSLNGYDLQVNFKKNFNFKFKILIQNSATNIIQLVNTIVPESQQQLAKALSAINKKNHDSSVSKIKQKQSAQQSRQKDASVDKQNSIQHSQAQKKQSSFDRRPNLKQKQNNKQQFGNILQAQSQVQQSQTPSVLKSQNQSLNLQIIKEDKQKQDKSTPANKLSKFSHSGSVEEAIGQVLSKNQIHQQRQQHEQQIIQPLSSKRQQLNKQIQLIDLKFQTPDKQVQVKQQGGNDQIQQKIKQRDNNSQKLSKQQNKSKKSIKMKNNVKIQNAQDKKIQDPNANNNKFKKIVIVILILILLGGVLGTLFSNNKKEKQHRKSFKKGKKNQHIKQKNVNVKL